MRYMRIGSTRRTAIRNSSELELKFEVSREAVRRLRDAPPVCGTVPQVRALSSIYFDTPGGAVREQGFSIRVRHAGDHFVQTVKACSNGAGMFERSEWESEVPALEVDADALAETPLRDLDPGKLVTTLRSDVERTTWELHRGQALIEMALDEGGIGTNGRQTRVRELELELKQGKPRDLFDLARELNDSLSLKIGVLSKQERGQWLAEGKLGRARKADPLHFASGMPVADVFAAIVQACIRQFRLNEELIVKKQKPEGLHQGRVAMRRLRAALTLFRPAIRRQSLRELRDELRWFTGSLGDARNLDVFLRDHRAVLSPAEEARVVAARDKAYRRAIAAIDSQRLRNLLLGFVEWLAIGDWQKKEASDPIEDFAAEQLSRLWSAVEACADVRALDVEKLHRLRIEIKKLRYGAEFLGSLYEAKRVKRFTGRLETLQDDLGSLNDQAVAREIAGELGIRLPNVDDGRPAEKLISAIEHDLRRLQRAGPFWTP